jgi:Uma2 family endonuclease
MQPITDIAQLDLNGSYTYADYLLWQFQERLELIKGHIFKMAAPNPAHQLVAAEVARQMGNYLHKTTCKLFIAPFDVRLVNARKSTPNNEVTTVVQPDICVVCDPTKIDKRGCIGAPDLIVEILSPATAKKDLNDKYTLYEENGVREYWIVHPYDGVITVFELNEQAKYERRGFYTKDEQLKVGIFDNCYINLPDVFEGLEDW